MATQWLIFIALAFAFTVLSAGSIEIRQDQTVEHYIEQVEAALVAIDSIRNGCIAECCSDFNYLASLDEQGYDGGVVQLLLCEVAVGFDIFPDLDYSEEQFSVALDGLRRAAASPEDSSRALFCREYTLDVDAFGNAGLDGEAISTIVCAQDLLGSDEAIVSITTTRSTNGVSISATRSETSSNARSISLTIQQSAASPTTSLTASLTSSALIEGISSSQTTASFSPPISASIGSASSIQSASTSSSRQSTVRSTISSPAIPSQTTAASDNFSLVVVTTLVTVTVTPIPLTEPTTLTLSAAAPPLPPLRFTLASRVVPVAGDPVVMPADTTELPNWTIGPPLGFTRTSRRSTVETSSITTVSDA